MRPAYRPNIMTLLEGAMHLCTLAVVATATCAICACTGSGSLGRGGAESESVAIPLRATPANSGNSGRVTLLPMNGATGIRLEISGVPGGTTAPIHVYTYIYEAQCAALPNKAVYALNDRVLALDAMGNRGLSPRGPYNLVHIAPLSMSELLSGRFSIALRSAPADGDQVIFCGELRRA